MIDPNISSTVTDVVGKSSKDSLILAFDDRSQDVLQRELIVALRSIIPSVYSEYGETLKTLNWALRNIVQDILENTHYMDRRYGGIYLYSPKLLAYVRFLSNDALVESMCRSLQTVLFEARQALPDGDRSKLCRPGDMELRPMLGKALMVTASPKQIDRDAYLLFANGRIELTTEGHTPKFIPEPVDPRVFHDHTLKARFLENITDPPECLNQLFEGIGYTTPELREALTDVMFYCLTSHTDWELAFLFLGPGANGKSTILKFLRGVIGEEFTAATSLSQLQSQFGLGPLIHARISLSAEDGGGEFFDSAIFKAVVTRDYVQVNLKFRDPVTVELAAKFIFAMNEAPAISDTSYGMLRRLAVFRFDQAIPPEKRIPNFDKKLLANADAIVSWIVKDHFQRHGRVLSSFTLDTRPTLNQWHTDFFLASLETFESFIERTIVPSDAANSRVSYDDLMKRYQEQAAEHKWSDKITKPQTFGKKIRAAWKLLHPGRPELTTEKSNSVTYYLGMTLKGSKPAEPAKPSAAVLTFTPKPPEPNPSTLVTSGIIRDFRPLDDFVNIGTSTGNFKCKLEEWTRGINALLGPKASAAQINDRVRISSAKITEPQWMTAPTFELVAANIQIKRVINL